MAASLAPSLVEPPIVTTVDIVEEYENRLKRYADRDVLYDTFEKYYRGYNNAQGTLPILMANSQGRPLLRPVGESINIRRTYSSQRLSPVVDDFSALLGRMPTTRAEPPDPSQQGEQRAELLTKYLYSTYELSRMSYQQAQSGHYLSCLGDSVYVLEPDPDILRVAWNVVTPRNVYPAFYNGYRRFEVYDAIIAEVWSRRDLRTQWGINVERDDPDDTTVLTYTSPYQRTVLVGVRDPQRVSHVEWDLGFCPVVWVYNKVTGVMGMSDIAQSLQQQDFLDFCLNVWADGIVHMTYPMLGIKNPMNMSGDSITIGPGAPPVVLQGDGDIIVRNTQGDPRALEAIITQTLQDMMAATGSSQVRQEGKMQSSITTGRAVQNVQGPQSTRIDFKQQVLGEAIEAANKMTLAMQEKAPALKDFYGPIYGNYKGLSFQEMFDASKDIDGWYRTKVTWPALVGMNLQQKAQVAYEGMVAKLWDDIEGREIVGVEDPLGMRKRIESQMMAEAKLQSEMQQTMEGGQGQQQPGGGVPSGGQLAAQDEQRPAPPLFRPPRAGGGGVQGGGAQVAPQPPPPPQNQLQSLIGKLAGQLRGEVWMAPDGRLLITDSRDYSVVLQVARLANPQAKVRQTPASRVPAGATRIA